MFAGADMVTAVGMRAPLPYVLLVMGTEVVAILGTKVVIRPALIVVVSIASVLVLTVGSPAIIFTPGPARQLRLRRKPERLPGGFPMYIFS